MDKVLLIDDNKALANILSRLLKKSDYDVLHVDSFDKGLELIEDNFFYAIILGVPLTGFENIDSLFLLEEKGILKNKNLLLFTGLDIPDSVIEDWKEKGLHSLIKKPVEFDKIIAELNTIVLKNNGAKSMNVSPIDKALEQKMSEQKALEQKMSEQKALEQKMSEQKALEQKMSEQKALEQKMSEQNFADDLLNDDKVKEMMDEIHSTFDSIRFKLKSINSV